MMRTEEKKVATQQKSSMVVEYHLCAGYILVLLMLVAFGIGLVWWCVLERCGGVGLFWYCCEEYRVA